VAALPAVLCVRFDGNTDIIAAMVGCTACVAAFYQTCVAAQGIFMIGIIAAGKHQDTYGKYVR
jgi:hypothetical protein